MTAASLKLFVGVPVAPAVAHALAGAAETLARRARTSGVALTWVPPAHYHVTLAFLGAARPEVVTAVRAQLATVAAAGRSFRFRAGRLGAFPSVERATVLWAGVEDASGELARLADAVAAAMTELGFERDRRAFHPHVTVARLRDPSAIADLILPLSEQVFGETRCDAVTLFESVVTSNGSEYRSIARTALGTPKTAPERQSEPVQTGPFDASHGSDDGWDRTP
ncbi:MAG: RNA 2',3'-cyclic phosphodiesterase [Myxococcales bacterium]|nr:RNA 2',3'-cyclic phosphodiesterase [Myxococcales bacterium]